MSERLVPFIVFIFFPSRKLFKCKLQEKVLFFIEGNKGNQCLSVRSIVNIMNNFVPTVLYIYIKKLTLEEVEKSEYSNNYEGIKSLV